VQAAGVLEGGARGDGGGAVAGAVSKKNTGLPLAGPDQARGLRLSPSRSTCLSTRPTSPP
jgi:hypothetical protein